MPLGNDSLRGLSNSEKEDQRSVREGFLEEMELKLGLEGKGEVRLVKRCG